MQISNAHSWDLSPKEAVQLQKKLLPLVTQSGTDPERVKTIAGCDVSYSKAEDKLYAAVAVFSYPALALLESASCVAPVRFPYVPGLLAFREAPAILPAMKRLGRRPDLLMVDGHGVAHPRGLGVASHIGVVLNVATIGVAKSLLCGEYSEPDKDKGSYSSLMWRDKIVGRVVRTRSGVKPVFVSVGTKIALEDATRIVLDCCKLYRLPEPLRQAHLLCNRLRTSKRSA